MVILSADICTLLLPSSRVPLYADESLLEFPARARSITSGANAVAAAADKPNPNPRTTTMEDDDGGDLGEAGGRIYIQR